MHPRGGASSRRGVRRLRVALALADGRSEPPWATLMRVLHVVCGIEVVPQHEVFDPGGRFAARGDLWVRGTRLLQEYDGAQHRDPAERRRDLDRERRIGDAGFARRGYTARTVIDHPYEILRPAAEALGRPGGLSRRP